jgi:CRISPR/Cas system-associated exonuclease Cas4 (RecB family)
MISPAEFLTKKFWALKQSRIRVTPCNSTRASSIGLECERQLFYEQTAWEMKQPPSPELQCLFDLGNEMEPIVFRELEAMGVQVLQRGKDYIDRKHNITGHVDGKLSFDGTDKPIPAEIKGLNPFTAGKIETIDDIKNHAQAWVRKYYAQLQIYLYLDSSELGVFVLMDKSGGQIKFIDCPLDYEFAESLLQKAARVKVAVETNAPPDRHQTADCNRCPFVHVCNPDIEFGKGVELFDNPEIEAQLARREELAPLAKEYEAIDKAIKTALPHKPELLVGDWALIGTEVSKKGFEVKPSKFWQWKIRKVVK